MSKTLIIRHLPQSLSFQEKQQLLKHFGAEQVWETAAKRNYIFASFPSVETAKSSLSRLHQLELAKRRLVVEYSFDNELKANEIKDSEESSIATNHVKQFLKALNAWNPSLSFYQPPPAHLKYKYPDFSIQIAINVINALFSNKSLYIQTLHLMNKMSLDLPFSHNEESMKKFKEMFREIFAADIPVVDRQHSDQESEISSEEGEKPKHHVPTMIKRKHILPKTRKRPAVVLSSATLPRAKKIHVKQNEVFENVVPVIELKKIAVNVPQELQKQPDVPEVLGELGKFQKVAPLVVEEQPPEPEQPTITKNELLKNRISYSDMKILPVFKNYHPGQPSMRLYIKNLAKTVTEQDVKRIYKRYVEHLSEDEENGFDVRVMQEGRMKGQAFVTFPSVRLAERALNETNGYMLKERPLVVQFARVANKKTIE